MRKIGAVIREIIKQNTGKEQGCIGFGIGVPKQAAFGRECLVLRSPKKRGLFKSKPRKQRPFGKTVRDKFNVWGK
ncbi:MAG: hypothetical protein ACOX7J_07355 [Bacillota bacterium]